MENTNKPRKYELTDDTIKNVGHTLHRIKALVDINDTVKAGTIGGWIESEKNLSHTGSCWVYDDAKVLEDASIHNDAKVRGNAKVFGRAEVRDDADVYDNAVVCDSAKVDDNARVCGNAWIAGNAWVYDNAVVRGCTSVRDHVLVYGDAVVSGKAWIHEMARIFGDCNVSGCATVRSKAVVADGEILNTRDIITVGPIGSRADYVTYNKVSGTVCVGCFQGTLDEFEKAVKAKHGDNEHGKDYAHFIAYIKAVLADTQTE